MSVNWFLAPQQAGNLSGMYPASSPMAAGMVSSPSSYPEMNKGKNMDEWIKEPAKVVLECLKRAS